MSIISSDELNSQETSMLDSKMIVASQAEDINKPPTSLPIKGYGITGPVNTDIPTKEDIKNTEDLKKFTRSLDIFESDDIIAKKVYVLSKLNKIAKSWIIEILIKSRIPEYDAKRVGGHIRTFGSHYLGVSTKGGDIDAVLICSHFIKRHDFFESFAPYLKSRSDVKEFRTIPLAYVPLIKFVFCDIQFDLLFCSLNYSMIDENIDIRDVNILRGCSPKDIRSINGVRINQNILNLVPCVEDFKLTLQVIKYWAKQHHVYSNIIGFLGGISWVILVARICQLYPCAIPATLVSKFFMLYSSWDWEALPVVLEPIVYGLKGMTLPQWHRQKLDENLLMCIITPTYPEQNTAHNVSLSTRTVMMDKMKDTHDIILKIFNKEAVWADIFVPKNFFKTYMHFIILTAQASSAPDLLEWTGFIESRIRLLVNLLEKNIFVKLAHPFSQSFDPLPSENMPNTKRWFIGLQINKQEEGAKLNINLQPEIGAFEARHLKTKYEEEKKISFGYVKKSGLKNYLLPEVIGRSSRKKHANSPHPGPLQLSTGKLEVEKNLFPQKRKCMPESEEYKEIKKNMVTLPEEHSTSNGLVVVSNKDYTSNGKCNDEYEVKSSTNSHIAASTKDNK